MYAVIETGGLQYRVEPGMKLSVAKLEKGEGETVSFDKVMLLSGADGVTVGSPLVPEASVEAKILSHMKGPKLVIFHRKRRKGHEKRTGHRQDLTLVEITGIRGK